MAALNGFSMLRSIGENPQSFPALSAEVGKTAIALITKQLKALSESYCRILLTA